jgi:peptidoglycan/xylan/chitin deacetylase (PgdA/CDA1 family)
MRAYSLMYHDVVPAGAFDESGIQGADADLYKLDRAEFRRHLDAIAALGRERVKRCLDQWQHEVPVFLTFDDGGASAPWIAGELEQRGWRGHFFITTDWIGQPRFATAADLRDIASRGHVIGSHSCSHPMRMSALSESEMRREWRESLARLSDVLGAAVQVASVPGGHYSRRVGETGAASGLSILFTSEPTPACARVGECLVLGRYFLQQNMGPEIAQSYAGGAPGPRRKQALVWKVKKAAKAVGGEIYVRARKSYLERQAHR